MAPSSKSSSQLVVDPQSSDILCGKGKECHDFEGSQHYRMMIDSFRHKYSAAFSRGQKMAVTTEIYDLLKSMNCRFLRYNPSLQAWEELSLHAARDKIGHALRFANRSTRRGSETDDLSPPDLSAATSAGSIELAMGKAATNSQGNESVVEVPPALVLSRSVSCPTSAASSTKKSGKQAKKAGSLTKSQVIRERVDAKLREKRWLLALRDQQDDKSATVANVNGALSNPFVAAFGSGPPQDQQNEIAGIEDFWDQTTQIQLAQHQAGKTTANFIHAATNMSRLHPASQAKQPPQWSRAKQPLQWGHFLNQIQKAADSPGSPSSPAAKPGSTMPSFCVRECLSLAQAGQHMHASNCMTGQLQQRYHSHDQELPLDSSLEPTPLPVRLPHALEPTPLPLRLSHALEPTPLPLRLSHAREPTPLPLRLSHAREPTPLPLRPPHAAMARQDNPQSNVDWDDIKVELMKTFRGSDMASPFAPDWDNSQYQSVSSIGHRPDLDATAASPELEEQLLIDSLQDMDEGIRCFIQQNPSSRSQAGHGSDMYNAQEPSPMK